jgi:death-on-curing protein
VNDVDYLDFHDINLICQDIIPGYVIRDEGLLLSALERPQTQLYGVDAYPTFPFKVAALMHSLARNHALIDGNKRLAWSAGRIFCLMNGLDIYMDVDSAESLVVGIAAGKYDLEEIVDRLKIE